MKRLLVLLVLAPCGGCIMLPCDCPCWWYATDAAPARSVHLTQDGRVHSPLDPPGTPGFQFAGTAQ